MVINGKFSATTLIIYLLFKKKRITQHEQKKHHYSHPIKTERGHQEDFSEA